MIDRTLYMILPLQCVLEVGNWIYIQSSSEREVASDSDCRVKVSCEGWIVWVLQVLSCIKDDTVGLLVLHDSTT